MSLCYIVVRCLVYVVHHLYYVFVCRESKDRRDGWVIRALLVTLASGRFNTCVVLQISTILYMYIFHTRYNHAFMTHFQGEKGDQGPQGVKGDEGSAGDMGIRVYTHSEMCYVHALLFYSLPRVIQVSLG